MKTIKPKFRSEIFWDTDVRTIDYQKHAHYVIGKVIKWGNFDDWQELKRIYSTKKIKSEIKKISDLDDKDKNFLHIIYNIPLNQLCSTRQSIKKCSPFYLRSVK